MTLLRYAIFLALLTLAPPAYAVGGTPAANDLVIYEDTTGANVIGSGLNITNVASRVATNALLAAAPNSAYPQGVWRDRYFANVPSPQVFFQPQAGTCAAAAMNNDGGTCVNTGDGLNSWKAVLGPVLAASSFGLAVVGVTDQSVALQQWMDAGFTYGRGNWDDVSGVVGFSDVRFYPNQRLGCVPTAIFQKEATGPGFHSTDAIGHATAQALVPNTVFDGCTWDGNGQIGPVIMFEEVNHPALRNFYIMNVGAGNFAWTDNTGISYNYPTAGVLIKGAPGAGNGGSYSGVIENGRIDPFGQRVAGSHGIWFGSANPGGVTPGRPHYWTVSQVDLYGQNTLYGFDKAIEAVTGNDGRLDHVDGSFANTGLLFDGGDTVGRWRIHQFYCENCQVKGVDFESAAAANALTFASTSGTVAGNVLKNASGNLGVETHILGQTLVYNENLVMAPTSYGGASSGIANFGRDADQSYLETDSFGNAASLNLVSYGGTNSSPAALGNSTVLGNLNFGIGWDGTALRLGAYCQVKTTEAWVHLTNGGAQINCYKTVNGSVTATLAYGSTPLGGFEVCAVAGCPADPGDGGIAANFVRVGATGLVVNGTVLRVYYGTTASIGGGALAADTCASGTVTITGVTTTMAVSVSPVTFPGNDDRWEGYVSGADVVTVVVCANAGSTPVASAYNVRVIQ